MHQFHLRKEVKKIICFLALSCCAVNFTLADSELEPVAEMGLSLEELKQAFQARIVGLELYSQLTFPAIEAGETKEFILAKLKLNGFRVLERDGIVNIIDAAESKSGNLPYPFSQKLKIKKGVYTPSQLYNMIRVQTKFGIFRFDWKGRERVPIEFKEDTELPVREVLNRIAEKIRGRWIINRSAPVHDGAQKPDELNQTNQLNLSTYKPSYLIL